MPCAASPRVSVIIPTITLDLVLAALRCLARNAPRNIPFETIVVVNGSSAEFAAEIREQVTGVRIVQSTVNRGLAGAANLGRSFASGESLVLLHDDAEIEPGWLEALTDAADRNSQAGAIGGKVLTLDGRLQNAGMVLWSDATSAPPWIGETPPPTAFDEARLVDYCGTSSLLVRATVWDAIGGLDERFYPAYYVDVDLAMSVRQLGYSVLYQPASRIRHHGGASGDPRWRTFVSARNRMRFIEKWGAALELQPVYDGDIDAAASRAARRSQRPPPPECRPSVMGVMADESAYLDAARDLADQYRRHLSEALDRADRDALETARRLADLEQEVADLRAISRYLFGHRIEFHANGDAQRYQCAGGHPPEDWGRWLGSEPFRIVLPLDESSGDLSTSHLRLHLEAVSYLDDVRKVSQIAVAVDGRSLIVTEETQPGVQHYTATFAAANCSASGAIVVTVQGCDAMSPSSTGGGDDTRQLSVGLVALAVDRVDPA